MLLTYEQIDMQCAWPIDNVTRYGIHIDTVLQIMYNTGLRVNEVYQLERWRRVSDTSFIVMLEKGNGERACQTDELTSWFTHMVDGQPDTKWLYTVRQIRYILKNNSPFYGVTSGDKEVVCHLYRYRKAKQLHIIGYSDNEVKDYLHHRSLDVTQQYIYGEIAAIGEH